MNWRSRYLLPVKLDPHREEEEDPATAVVVNKNHVKELERKDSTIGQEYMERVVLDLDEDDGASTLVGHEHENGMYGEKEVEMEVDDSEDEEDGRDGGDCGVKRKRTIRVIIRSRAFL
jgi:hypothetical protein